MLIANEKELGIIKKLIDYPERIWMLTELSKESGIPKTTVWRIINRFVDLDIVLKSYAGKTETVKIKNNDYLKELLKILDIDQNYMKEIAKKYAKEIYKIKAVKKCILFGSVARNTANLKSDIDILILITKTCKFLEDEVNIITEKMSHESGVRVMPDIVEIKKFKKWKSLNPFSVKIYTKGELFYE